MSPGKMSATRTVPVAGRRLSLSPMAMLLSFASVAVVVLNIPDNPAILFERFRITATPASLATRDDMMVAPAPVSMTKLYRPRPLIQSVTSNPRPGTSRKYAGRGMLNVEDRCAGGKAAGVAMVLDTGPG